LDTSERREQERKSREKSIIDTAERLFLEKGFESSPMEEIAHAAGFTKRTVYQYFLSKEELLFAVAVRQLSKADFTPLPGKPDRTLTALEWLKKSCEEFFETCRNNLIETTFVNRAFLIMDSAENGTWKSTFQERTMEYYRLIMTAMQEGINEGSMRTDLVPAKAAFAFLSVLTDFVRYASADSNEKSIYRPMPAQELFQYSLNMLLRSTAASPDTQLL
jgi:AcrR family transcriptional regulator